jgi:hypothetical protein
MAAGAWTFYNLAKKYIGNGVINLGSGAFRMQLHTSASNANTATLSTIGSVDNQVTEANGYSSSGKALANRAWTVGQSAGQYKFDADDSFWSANGGAISNIKFAVIWVSGASAGARKLLVRSQLSSSQFSLSSGNRLTIQHASTGIFTLA